MFVWGFTPHVNFSSFGEGYINESISCQNNNDVECWHDLAYKGNKYVTILLLSYSLNRIRNKCYVLNEWNTLIFPCNFNCFFFYTHLLGPLGQDRQVLMSRWILMETTCNHILYVCLIFMIKLFHDGILSSKVKGHGFVCQSSPS